MQVEVFGTARSVSRNFMREMFVRACKVSGAASDGRVEVSFVTDVASRKLNKKFRGKDAPTDVLSFGYPASLRRKEQIPFFGEIIIALGVARRQAKEQEHSLKVELTFLLVHGFLHLLGYDHEKAQDARVMFHLQKKILSQL